MKKIVRDEAKAVNSVPNCKSCGKPLACSATKKEGETEGILPTM
jgi:hypothetical protein